MKLNYENHDNLCVVKIKGDITADQIEPLRKLVHESEGGSIRDFVIDLADVEFVDSRGLETLLWIQDNCSERLGQVRLAAPSENVRKILHVTRLSGRFDQHDAVDTAIRSLHA